MIEVLSKYIVYHVLGDCRSIGKTKWHHLVLEMFIARPKGRFPLVLRLDAHQIVGSPKIDFGEDTSVRSRLRSVGIKGKG